MEVRRTKPPIKPRGVPSPPKIKILSKPGIGKGIRPGIKVVILCGACVGEDLEKYRRYFPNAHIYAIEPVKESFDAMVAKYGKRENITFINKACWIENGKREINIYHSAMSHSLYRKPKLERESKLQSRREIETMDFAEFLRGFSSNEVHVRMDIEGSEYKVLLRCFEQGVMDRIIQLDIEFHAGWRIPNLEQMHVELKALLDKWNRPVLEVA